jgi:acetylornithine deacetylase/succinyl-diaminopimelate desuccinylase-like protein
MTWTRSDNEILATLQELVAIDSVNPALPGGQQGESAMVEYLSSFFTALDIPYELSEVRPGRHNFIARIEGENPERKLLFECHMDTASAEVMRSRPSSRISAMAGSTAVAPVTPRPAARR